MIRRRRGQAAVEMSLLMVLTLPLIFYALFLQDVLAYKLDEQEAVVAAPWDFTIINFQRDKGVDRAHDIQSANRKTFCDHTSAYNTYSNFQNDCNGKEALDHHKAMAAHACWIFEGNKGQVACALDESVGLPSAAGAKTFAESWNRGGMGSCQARLGVFNKFLPQRLFQKVGGSGQSFSKVEVTHLTTFSDKGGPSAALKTTHNAGEVDDVAPEANGDPCLGNPDQLCLTREKFGIIVDTWAVNGNYLNGANGRDVKELDPNLGGTGLTNQADQLLTRDHDVLHPSYDRSANYYVQQKAWADRASQFVADHGSGFLHPSAAVDSVGDFIGTPSESWSEGAKRERLDAKDRLLGYSSGWSDERQRARADWNIEQAN